MPHVFHHHNNKLKLTLVVFTLISASLVLLFSLRLSTCNCLLHPNSSPGVISEPLTNISHLLFGIGGSVHTWTDRRHYSHLWWQPNITRGFVWLDKEPDPGLFDHPNSVPFKVSENLTRLNISVSNPNPAVRVGRIVLESFKLGLPNVRWFVMGDDDTVFFVDNLVSVLSKYDYRKMYYVGGSSESVEQVVMHSYDMAFGGGGFVVSYGLAAELGRIFDTCLERFGYSNGDQRVWACVTDLGVSLTNERGFHQMDIRGNAYGLLAAHPMTPLVSLHHLDYIDPILPNLTKFESLSMLIQTYRFDPPRAMQQTFCYYKTWSISVSWGYTVQIYPFMLTAHELMMPLQTFRTWRSSKDGPFTFNTRPVSTNLCELPAVFCISQVQEVGNDTVTTYTRVKSVKICKRRGYPSSIEKVVVMASKMNPNYWIKEPRRQCCEIKGWKYKCVKIQVRSCKDGETIATYAVK